MRDQAFRNLLLGYNLIYGIESVLVFIYLAMLDTKSDAVVVYIAVTTAIILIPAVAVNWGVFTRQSWGAWVAFVQSSSYSVTYALSFVSLQIVLLMVRERSIKLSVADKLDMVAGFTICGGLAQLFVAVLAWRAIHAPKDDGPPILRNSNDGAMEILAFAYGADGKSRPEALELVWEYADQLLGSVSKNAAFKARIMRVLDSPSADAILERAVARVAVAFGPRQKAWLLAAVRAICSDGGDIDPLAESFITDLDERFRERNTTKLFRVDR